MLKFALTLLLAGASAPVLALSAEEKTSRACEKIYASLCKDVPAGPDQLFFCGQKHENLAIPEKCQADYQQKFEGIVDAETAECVSAATPMCKAVDASLDGANFLTACEKAKPGLFRKLKPICKALSGS